ncbi:MAG: SMC-Scp complex subunit ScpB [Planctomycetes bacterium]|nr:SMC-Scp complex subunit ScpB [Planctomycetota bacterium]
MTTSRGGWLRPEAAPITWAALVAPQPGIAWLWKLANPAEVPASDAPTLAVACRRTPKMARAEAVLLVADAPLSPRRLAQLATLADATEARTQINRLNAAYEQAGTPFRVERVAAGYRLFTLPQFAFWLGKLHHRDAELKLSPPSMETLTIIAYRQPITRADVEAIRGVQCSEMIKQLMERNLVRIGGEDDSLGRPFLYETTRKFLETFGLRDLDELPLADRLRRRPTTEGSPASSDNAPDADDTPPVVPVPEAS